MIMMRLPPCVEVNAYDLSRLAHDIVHLAIGPFHQAHQAVYTNDARTRVRSRLKCDLQKMPMGYHSRRRSNGTLPLPH